MRHPGIVGNDVERIAALRERADHLRAFAFEDADDRAGFLVAITEIFPAHVAPHEHAVFMQRSSRDAFGNGDFLETRIVRLEKTFASAVHADAAGDQVGLARRNVAVALDARGGTGLFELEQRGLQILLAVGRQAQQPEQFWHIRRDVVFLREQIQNPFFHESKEWTRTGRRAIFLRSVEQSFEGFYIIKGHALTFMMHLMAMCFYIFGVAVDFARGTGMRRFCCLIPLVEFWLISPHAATNKSACLR